MTSIDVNGYDNQPEWGYCLTTGCTEAALPIWLSGEYPDDADLYLCEKHIGSQINALVVVLRAVIGSRKDTLPNNVMRLDVDRTVYEAAWRELLIFGSFEESE